MHKEMTPDEREIHDLLIGTLPPVVARQAVPDYFGKIVSAQTLANMDCQGQGPDGSFKFGEKVMYRTDKLVPWLITRYGVRRLRPEL